MAPGILRAILASRFWAWQGVNIEVPVVSAAAAAASASSFSLLQFPALLLSLFTFALCQLAVWIEDEHENSNVWSYRNLLTSTDDYRFGWLFTFSGTQTSPSGLSLDIGWELLS